MTDKFSERVVVEDIKAEVEKTNSRLIFSGVVLFLAFIAFCVRTCANQPPDIDNSVQCIKAGGQWVPEEYKVVDKNEYAKMISAHCSSKNINKDNL